MWLFAIHRGAMIVTVNDRCMEGYYITSTSEESRWSKSGYIAPVHQRWTEIKELQENKTAMLIKSNARIGYLITHDDNLCWLNSGSTTGMVAFNSGKAYNFVNHVFCDQSDYNNMLRTIIYLVEEDFIENDPTWDLDDPFNASKVLQKALVKFETIAPINRYDFKVVLLKDITDNLKEKGLTDKPIFPFQHVLNINEHGATRMIYNEPNKANETITYG